MVETMGLDYNYGVEFTFNGMSAVLNLIKIYQLIQKLLVGDTQTDDLASPPFIFIVA
jgi:hypothetical protein